jgi:hypothetical protein
MKAIPRWCSFAVLATAAALCAGCQASTLAYFLFPEAKHEAEMKKLADDKKEVRVLLLTYTTNQETQPEFIQADRQLTEILAQKLREMCEENNENVTIVNPHKVEEFKSSHPNWQQEPNLTEIGRQFKADYVIYIEIGSLTMYEKQSRILYHGQASLSVQLVDVHKPEETPLPRQFSCIYPDAKGPIPIDDMQPGEFRQQFLGYLALRLGRFFTATPIADSYYVE